MPGTTNPPHSHSAAESVQVQSPLDLLASVSLPQPGLRPTKRRLTINTDLPPSPSPSSSAAPAPKRPRASPPQPAVLPTVVLPSPSPLPHTPTTLASFRPLALPLSPTFPPQSQSVPPKAEFLAPFGTLFDALLSSKLQLDGQIKRSEALLETLAAAGTMIESLVRSQMKTMMNEFGAKVGVAMSDLDARVKKLEGAMRERERDEGRTGSPEIKREEPSLQTAADQTTEQQTSSDPMHQIPSTLSCLSSRIASLESQTTGVVASLESQTPVVSQPAVSVSSTATCTTPLPSQTPISSNGTQTQLFSHNHHTLIPEFPKPGSENTAISSFPKPGSENTAISSFPKPGSENTAISSTNQIAPSVSDPCLEGTESAANVGKEVVPASVSSGIQGTQAR